MAYWPKQQGEHMNILDRIDSAQAAEGKSFTLIPEGEYVAQVTDVTIKSDAAETKLNVEFTITKGEYTGRKCWWSSNLKDTATDKQLGFVKGQIQRLAGVESTNGDVLGTLSNAKGNYVALNIGHKPGFKDPSKTYLDVYVQGVTDDTIPF
jgi:hypothetical protein